MTVQISADCQREMQFHLWNAVRDVLKGKEYFALRKNPEGAGVR